MTYLATVLADAPDHYWRMADPGGFICHDIGSAPYTIEATTECLPYTGPNSDGGSLAVPGVGGPRTQQGILLPSPRTLECWIFPIGPPGLAIICGFNGIAANQWGLSTDATAHAAMSVNGTNVISATVITAEAWHHLVGTYDGTNARLYLDSILVAGPQAIAAPGNVARQICWGSNGTPANIMFGAISECATYPVALAAARVPAHFGAADNVPSSPVFRGGAFSTGSGQTSGGLPSDTAAILAAVRKSY